MEKLEEGYYQINKTKKILYWDGVKWLKPEKDQQRKYGAWLSQLEKQPKIKTVDKFSVDKIGTL